jgi:hypothetical protein
MCARVGSMVGTNVEPTMKENVLMHLSFKYEYHIMCALYKN